ncbi:nucleotidyl transferase AbiEii/AbiGii toxin family protein [Candidatus Poriferisocius sp.]|uniref:nucleotidyl transferase AbiEii/AbiGii toxin family protein n=1 Tax=Candidatus Poriferisocius sp. TaxID=3101276 RepID=UPI003B5A32D5
MTGIDEYADVLPDGLRLLWPTVAEVAHEVKGRLVGGTALAVHLRHRQSEDLDVMTLREFSGRSVAKRMQAAGRSVAVIETGPNMFHARVDDVKVDVFRALPTIHEVGPSDMTWIRPAVRIDGMPVASPADIMATKLDTITRRAKLRDYIDIYALDVSGACSLEDGLSHYCKRNGHDYPPPAHGRLVHLLEEPGVLDSDPQHADMADTALSHLRGRAPELMDYVGDSLDIEAAIPPLPSAAVPPHRRPLSARGYENPSGECGRLMPRARKRCVLRAGHSGPCRSKLR